MSIPGFWEWAALAVLALLIFGPDRLPGMLRNAGKTVGTIRREARSALQELKDASDVHELRDAAKELRDETDALRREGRDAGQAFAGTFDDGPTDRSGSPARRPASAVDARRADPAPFDPDTP